MWGGLKELACLLKQGGNVDCGAGFSGERYIGRAIVDLAIVADPFAGARSASIDAGQCELW